MTSTEAAACLGVKRATLYSYVARGLVRVVSSREGTKRYLAADVFALKRKAAAAKGHAAAAAVALDWGAPVLSTAISAVDRDGPSYRGRNAWGLAERDTSFEAVARGLWWGFADDLDDRPFEHGDDPAWLSILEGAKPNGVGTALRLAVALADDVDSPERMMDRLVRALATIRGRHADPGGAVADRMVAIYGLAPHHRGLVQRALVLCADHELNASTFAARIAASTGAPLSGALLAALGAFVGPRHGAQVLEVAALADEALDDPETVAPNQVAEGRLRGFGHRLYPEGDPRAEALLGWMPEDVGGLRAWLEAARVAGTPPPSLDVALLALTRVVDTEAPFAMAVFAIGRAAGWMAHVLEQRASPGVLRPRARYEGP